METGFNFKITEDNRQKILDAIEVAKDLILDEIGNAAVEHTVDNIDARTTAHTSGLRQSIDYRVDEDTVTIFSNIFYAPFVELGTLDNFVPPEEWEDYGSYSKRGSRGGKGIKPRHFMRDAIRDHIEEYRSIIRKYIF